MPVKHLNLIDFDYFLSYNTNIKLKKKELKMDLLQVIASLKNHIINMEDGQKLNPLISDLETSARLLTEQNTQLTQERDTLSTKLNETQEALNEKENLLAQKEEEFTQKSLEMQAETVLANHNFINTISKNIVKEKVIENLKNGVEPEKALAEIQKDEELSLFFAKEENQENKTQEEIDWSAQNQTQVDDFTGDFNLEKF